MIYTHTDPDLNPQPTTPGCGIVFSEAPPVSATGIHVMRSHGGRLLFVSLGLLLPRRRNEASRKFCFLMLWRRSEDDAPALAGTYDVHLCQDGKWR